MCPHDAFHQTVHAYPGGCEALAIRLGVNAQVLRNKANPNSTTNKPSLDEVDRVMTLTGDRRVLHALAQQHGFVCVEVETGGASDMAVLEMMAQVWSRNGDFGQTIHAALEDGRITRAEIAQIQDELAKASQSMYQLVERLGAMADPK